MIESNRLPYPMNSVASSTIGKQRKSSSTSTQSREDYKEPGSDINPAQKKQVVLRLIEFMKAN